MANETRREAGVRKNVLLGIGLLLLLRLESSCISRVNQGKEPVLRIVQTREPFPSVLIEEAYEEPMLVSQNVKSHFHPHNADTPIDLLPVITCKKSLFAVGLEPQFACRSRSCHPVTAVGSNRHRIPSGMIDVEYIANAGAACLTSSIQIPQILFHHKVPSVRRPDLVMMLGMMKHAQGLALFWVIIPREQSSVINLVVHL